jgi:hypothetical protein
LSAARAEAITGGADNDASSAGKVKARRSMALV